MAALLAAISSLFWGTGDFLGGRASRKIGVLAVLAWSQAAMLLLLWAAVLILWSTKELAFSIHAVAVGSLGGLFGVVALAAFYRALAIGPMSVVPPIAAAGVALPVSVGVARGNTELSTAVALGIAFSVVGVVLASIGEGSSENPDSSTRISRSTLGLCLVAASGFGIILVAMNEAAGSSLGEALQATAGVRLGSFSVLIAATLALRARPWKGIEPHDIWPLILIGLLDTSANLGFAISATFGELAVIAVLASLYPAVTSGLAHVVLGERLGKTQLLGVVLALSGVSLLALR